MLFKHFFICFLIPFVCNVVAFFCNRIVSLLIFLTSSCVLNHISGVLVSVLTLSVVDPRFLTSEPSSCRTKDYQISICYFYAKTGWLRIWMCPNGGTCLPANYCSSKKLTSSSPRSAACSPQWSSWKLAHLAFKQQSHTHSFVL